MEAQAPYQLPLSGAKLFLMTFFGALATFMEVLDITIANVSIPAISGSMAVSPMQGTWVVSTYAVATAIVMPMTGWLARRFGEVRLFLGSVSLFCLTSMLCGLSTSLPELLVFRALQGLVSGPMVALSQSLMLNAYPLEKRGLPMGIWGLTVISAPALGPVLGGWITESFSWPWIFLINVPIGIAIVTVCTPIMRGRETPIYKEPVDVTGLILLVVGVGAMQLVLDRGHELDWFESTTVIVLTVAAVTALVALVLWELGAENPVINLRLFANYNYSLGVFLITVGYFAFFCGVIIFPFWLQVAMGYTPLLAGLSISAVGVTSLILTPMVGKNIDRLNPKYLLCLGFLIFSFSCLWVVNTYNRDIDMWHIVMPRFLQGVGMALMFVPATAISLSHIPPALLASATGVSNFLRSLGASAAAAVSVTVWDHRTTVHYANLVQGWEGPDIANAGPAWSTEELPQGMLGMWTATQDAMAAATVDVFYMAGILFAALALVGLLVRPTKPAADSRLMSE